MATSSQPAATPASAESPIRREHLSEVVDPTGWEDTCSVFLSPSCLGEDGETLPASICISYRVDLSAPQARQVAARLLELADLAEAGQ